jgi:hypothetical protein
MKKYIIRFTGHLVPIYLGEKNGTCHPSEAMQFDSPEAAKAHYKGIELCKVVEADTLKFVAHINWRTS